MIYSSNAKQGLSTLLELNESVFEQEGGYWIKIDAWEVVVSAFMPAGVRYSLTLHDRHGTRVLGYDNAHAVKPPKKFAFAGQSLPHDHKHRTAHDKGVPYHFQSAQQLPEDFFAEVDKLIQESKK